MEDRSHECYVDICVYSKLQRLRCALYTVLVAVNHHSLMVTESFESHKTAISWLFILNSCLPALLYEDLISFIAHILFHRYFQIYECSYSIISIECQHTIQDLLSRAASPEKVSVGVCFQYDLEADREKCFSHWPKEIFEGQVRQVSP